MMRVADIRTDIGAMNDKLLKLSEELLEAQRQAVREDDQWHADTFECLIQNVGHAGRTLSTVHEMLTGVRQDAKFQWDDEQ